MSYTIGTSPDAYPSPTAGEKIVELRGGFSTYVMLGQARTIIEGLLEHGPDEIAGSMARDWLRQYVHYIEDDES